jgi:uncharacterized protein involved in exopolysaccharide biosynthesis
MTFKEGRAVRAKRSEVAALRREMEAMRKFSRAALPKLSAAYGALILNKVALEVQLDDLLDSFSPEHPDVKKRRVELAALEREIENIVGGK